MGNTDTERGALLNLLPDALQQRIVDDWIDTVDPESRDDELQGLKSRIHLLVDGWFGRFTDSSTAPDEQAKVEAEAANWVEQEVQTNHLIEVTSALMLAREKVSPIGGNLEEALTIIGAEKRQEIAGWRLPD